MNILKQDLASEQNILSIDDMELLNCFQKKFPLVSKPYLQIALELNKTEEEVMERFRWFLKNGYISRIGAVLDPKKIGASTLVAVSIADDEINVKAKKISQLPGVNHNYKREHQYNLWFVVTAANQQELTKTLNQAQQIAQSHLLDLPMVKRYHIDLGFSL